MNAEQASYIEREVGRTYTTDWLTVDQPMISAFADVTRDWNFLHVDPEKAGATEYGGTIAHGFLVLSLFAPLRNAMDRERFPGLRVGVNYGLERVRWVGPVPSGKRIRAHFTIAALVEEKPGRFREEMDVSVEVEGVERPALVARWITCYLI